MALTPSTMQTLGTPAPSFRLPDPSGRIHTLEEHAGRPLLVMFICNHCPFVIHVRDSLAAVTAEYMERGVSVVGINANDVTTHPADAPPRMQEEAERVGYRFPYLFDETQEVAQAYRASCTPDLFLYDSRHRLVYRGQYDGSRPGNGVAVDGRDLRAAMDAVLAGRSPSSDQTPSIGCNIKWKPGNAPSY